MRFAHVALQAARKEVVVLSAQLEEMKKDFDDVQRRLKESESNRDRAQVLHVSIRHKTGEQRGRPVCFALANVNPQRSLSALSHLSIAVFHDGRFIHRRSRKSG
jgi:hypothetical protein